MELTKNGYRYRDIAIVTGNQDSYADVIAEIFDRYGIPYYLDRNKDVLVNPLITLIRSVFKIIINAMIRIIPKNVIIYFISNADKSFSIICIIFFSF